MDLKMSIATQGAKEKQSAYNGRLESEHCHGKNNKKKINLLTPGKDLSSRQDKSFSQKDESQ